MTEAQYQALLERLDATHTSLEQLRLETEASFRAVRSQLSTVEYGVLTIAQKLLAETEGPRDPVADQTEDGGRLGVILAHPRQRGRRPV